MCLKFLIYFKDFEACVKAIHEQGYSSPHLTSVIGTSAGGLPVAVLCNNAPHLVKVAVLKVYIMRSSPTYMIKLCDCSIMTTEDNL